MHQLANVDEKSHDTRHESLSRFLSLGLVVKEAAIASCAGEFSLFTLF